LEKPAISTFRIEKSFAKDGRQWVLLKRLYLADFDVTSNENYWVTDIKITNSYECEATADT